MSDVDLLDMLFDDSNGLMELNERSSVSQTVTEPPPSFLQLQANPKCNNYNNIHQNSLEQVSHLCSTYFEAHSDSQLSSNTKLQRKDGMGTLPLDLDLFSENECAAQTHFQATSSNLDIDWSSNFLNSSLNLDGLDQNEFFNALMERNVPDDVKEQKQQQPSSKQCHDHAYSITPASPNSDSGVSSGPYSPSNSTNSLEDMPFDLERELFAPLDLKSYENADILPDVDPMLLDSLSDCGSSPGLAGNESPINFDFEDLNGSHSSTGVKGLTISTDETTKVIKVLSVNGSHTSLFSADKNSVVSTSSPYPELMLSDEEKNLLRKEGITLPTHLPLTREEEKTLRAVRRRIRNKASARNSRRKKQDYMEDLEKRVKLCTDEKRQLEKKVNELEKRNSSLIGQLRKLQKLVTDGTRQTAKTGTCAMILALSFALVLFPNYQSLLGNDSSASDEGQMTSSDMSGRPSRSLLSQSEDYISSVSLQEKSLNYISLLNNYNMAPQVSPVDSSVASNADSQHEYIHDPIDDAPSVSKYAPDLPVQTVDENVIHMEITKLPIEPATPAPGNQPVNINVSANTADILSEDTVRRRSIKMDIGDEL